MIACLAQYAQVRPYTGLPEIQETLLRAAAGGLRTGMVAMLFGVGFGLVYLVLMRGRRE